MGLGGINIWQLLIILAIVVLVFGTKRLRSLGTDVGGAVKGFRKAMTDEETPGLTQKDDGETTSSADATKDTDKTA